MPARAATLLLVIVATTLAGCGELAPYESVPRAPEPGQPPGARVAICYNGMTAAAEQVKAEAQQACPAGTEAQRVDTDWYLQSCPVLLPGRATFVCVPTKK